MDDGPSANGYYKDRLKFLDPYASKSYSGDTLTVRTVHMVNACGESTCALRSSGDTLHFITKKLDDDYCTSIEYRLFEYTVVSKRVRQFVISL